MEHGLHKIEADHYVFVKRYDEGDFLFLLLYVDDMLVVRQETKKIVSLKDLGLAKQNLGMHLVRDKTKSVLLLS